MEKNYIVQKLKGSTELKYRVIIGKENGHLEAGGHKGHAGVLQ